MFANYVQIQNRIRQITEELKQMEGVEKQWLSGELICAKNQNTYKWYLKDNGKTVYLPKKEINLAKKLARKKYQQIRKEELQRELIACRTYLRKADSKNDSLEKLLTNTEYERLLGEEISSTRKELAEWKKADYEKNMSHPENLIVKGTQGKFVRSKSEAIIDKTLYTNGIPFRYEDKLTIGNTTFYPDFTIRHPKTGEFYYWEHFGMMDHADYVSRACQKVKIYCDNGIIPTIHLILTYETKEHPLAIEQVERIVREYFL